MGCSARWARAAACSPAATSGTELGGLDERFALPGGGLANHDLYRRACALDSIELVVLLGEATFHQYHGGVATSRRLSWDEMHEEYQAIRGVPYRPPPNDPIFVGRVHPAVFEHVERSAASGDRPLGRGALITVGGTAPS